MFNNHDLNRSPTVQDGQIDPLHFTFDKFYRLVVKICPRTDLKAVFKAISNNEPYITVEQLINFLNETQRDPRLNEILFPFFTPERIAVLLEKYEPDKGSSKGQILLWKIIHVFPELRMSSEGFIRYVMSDENAPVFLNRVELFQDMDQPLCHYYINRYTTYYN